jgi:hypothetical protein
MRRYDTAGQATLHGLLNLTEQMLAAARSQDWRLLLALEASRRHLLERSLLGGAHAPVDHGAARILDRVLATDREIVRMEASARGEAFGPGGEVGVSVPGIRQ